MTTPMGPPPVRTPTAAAAAAATEPSPELVPTPDAEQEPGPESELKISMGPPPLSSAQREQEKPPQSKQPPSSSYSGPVPYTIPEWSAPPPHNFYLEVLKDGSIVHQLDTYEKGAYMFGRVDLCDFVLEHPTISRFHAVLQFKRNGTAYLYDLGSTHGTSINKNQVDKRVYVDLHVGDVIRFGQSSRLYIFQGPPDLMPPEADLKIHRNAKSRQEMLDRKASLERGRLEASLADGISWGIGEDAIEEAEDNGEEVTWQTYRGQLTEKQEKTREKILKRTEKIAHMRKEIDAIRAKDIGQGGLTQGQQTQIARNEQRMTQILEELENLEETLNESIRESLGARAGTRSRGKGTTEDDDEGLSDDDEFYDRTKKPSKEKAGENKSVETVDTLLDKRDVIVKEMEDKKELLLIEKNKVASETAAETEAGDVLDAYMSGLSTQLVLDKTEQLEKELSTLKSELDRIFFLLKIADPSGEAAKLRDSKAQELKPEKAEAPASAINEKPPREPKKRSSLEKPTSISMQKQSTTEDTTESSIKPDATNIAVEASEGKPSVYTVVKPQWLGAVDNVEKKETREQEVANMDGPDQFVDYKDRQKILTKVDSAQANVNSEIESASPGLIIRKRKETSRPEATHNDTSEQHASSTGPELMAEDAVALLLKHSKAYQAEDLEGMPGSQESSDISRSRKDKKKPRRVLGPEKPSFLNTESEYETWVPPKGQSGDGRTSLNDRFGY